MDLAETINLEMFLEPMQTSTMVLFVKIVKALSCSLFLEKKFHLKCSTWF